MDLRLLTSPLEDRDKARCRLSHSIMSKLSLTVGECATIDFRSNDNVNTIRVLCTCWTSKERAMTEHIRLDCFVWKFVDSLSGSIRSNDFGFVQKISSPIILTATQLKIRLKNVEKTNNQSNSSYSQSQIKTLLLGLVVSDGFLVGQLPTSIIFKQNESSNNDNREKSISNEFIEIVETIPSGFVQISSITKIIFVQQSENNNENTKNEKTNNSAAENSIRIGGLEKQTKTLHSLLSFRLQPERNTSLFVSGILIKGPTGVGKSLLIRHIAQKLKVHLIELDAPQIFGSFVGESEKRLRDKFSDALAIQAPLVILLIDDIDILCPKREGIQKHESRIVTQFLTLMDGVSSDKSKLVVIGTTSKPNSIDPALRRPGRFDREIEIGVPTLNERMEILKALSQTMPIAKGLNFDKLCEMMTGFVGADIEALCREAATGAIRRFKSSKLDLHKDNEKAVVSYEDFVSALTLISPSGRRAFATEVPRTAWNDVGGYEEVKKRLQQAIEWPLKHADAFKRMSVSGVHGILLWGPPGCSKTTLVRALATNANVSFFSLSGASIFSPYLGDAESAIREIYKVARLSAPSIIFLDEIEAIVGKREFGSDEGGDSVQDRVLSTLLNEMDGIEQTNDVVLVCATNRPDMLDAALLRPGRLDVNVFVGFPDKEARTKILQVHTRKMPLAKDVNLDSLADLTNNMSGADLENLCRESSLEAIRENIDADVVQWKHFEGAIKSHQTSRPSLPKWEMPVSSSFNQFSTPKFSFEK